MFQLQLFKSGRLLFRKALRAQPEDAIDEALLEMIKVGATGARLTSADHPAQVIWQEGQTPEAPNA